MLSSHVNSVTWQNFGLLIAYLIPGFIAVNGVAFQSSRAAGWLGGLGHGSGPTVGGFLFLTIAAVFAGLIASTFRWMLIDRILHATGIRRPDWDFRQLNPNLPAFQTLIEIHYRSYQFYANSMVAMYFYAAMRWNRNGFNLSEAAIVMVLGTVLLLGARDTLWNYYRRVDGFLAKRANSSD